MRMRRGGVVLALLVIAWSLARADEPRTNGQSLSELIKALQSKDQGLQLQAVRDLASMGAAAAPATPKLVALLRSAPEEIGAEAVGCLGSIGPEAKAAMPALLTWGKKTGPGELSENGSHSPLAPALRRIGPAAGSALLRGLDHAEPKSRAWAAFALGITRPKIVEAPKVLRQALNDKDGGVRFHAARALWLLEGPTPESLAGLIQALETGEDHIRVEAAVLLGRAGKHGREAAIALGNALLRDRGPVLQESLNSIKRLGMDARPAIGALVEFLKRDPNATGDGRSFNEDDFIAEILVRLGPEALERLATALVDPKIGQAQREHVAGAMGQFGAPAREPLIMALTHDEAAVRRAAITALDDIQDVPLEVLRKSLRDSDSQVRLAAVRLLVMKAPAEPGLIDALVSFLKMPDEQLRARATSLLGELTTQRRREILPILVGLVKDSDEGVAAAAAQALVAAGGADKLIQKTIVECLGHPAANVRTVAVGYFLGKQKEAKPHLHLLRALCHESFAQLRQCALHTVVNVDPDSNETFELFRDLLDGADDNRRWELLNYVQQVGGTVRARLVVTITKLYYGDTEQGRRPNYFQILGSLGKDGEAAVPFLLEQLQAEAPGASDALRRLGPVAAPALRKTLKSEDEALKFHAAQLLSGDAEAGEAARTILWRHLEGDNAQKRSLALAALTDSQLPLPDVLKAARAVLKDSDSSLRIQVAARMTTLGESGHPVLREILKVSSAEVRRYVMTYLLPYPKEWGNVFPVLRDDLPDLDAAHQLQLLRQVPRAHRHRFIGALAGLLRDNRNEVRREAAQLLGSCREARVTAVVALKGALKDGSREVRTAAAEALSALDPRIAKEAVPILIDAIQSGYSRGLGDDVFIRGGLGGRRLVMMRAKMRIAISGDMLVEHVGTGPDVALVRLGELAVPALTAILEAPGLEFAATQGVDARVPAAVILGKIGPPAKKALPALLALVEEADEELLPIVLGAIAELGPDASPAVPGLVRLFEKEAAVSMPTRKSRVRNSGVLDLEIFDNRLGIMSHAGLVPTTATACQVLAKLGPASKEALPALRKVAADKNHPLQIEAAAAVGRISGSGEVVELLGTRLDQLDRDLLRGSYVQQDFEEVVKALTLPENPEAVRRLRRYLQMAQRPPIGVEINGIRPPLVVALGKLGPAAKAAIPELRLEFGRPGQEWAAAEALWRISGDPGSLVPMLKVALASETDGDNRRDGGAQALSLIAELGPKGAELATAVRPLLKSESVHRRVAAAEALLRMGEKGEPIVGVLAKALRDEEDEGIRETAAKALTGIEDLPTAVRAVLQEALHDPSPAVRRAAKEVQRK